MAGNVFYRKIADDTLTSTPLYMTSAGFGVAASASSPSKVIMQRGSVSLWNTTKALNVGGVVRALRSGVGFGIDPTGITVGDFNNIQSYIQEHPQTHTTSANTLMHSKQWNAVPSNQSKAMDFQIPNRNFADWSAQVLDPASTLLMYHVPPPTEEQTYAITARGSWYTRYTIFGPLAHMGKPIEHAPLGTINGEREKELRDGSKPTR
jgi:hypothetical protein